MVRWRVLSRLRMLYESTRPAMNHPPPPGHIWVTFSIGDAWVSMTKPWGELRARYPKLQEQLPADQVLVVLYEAHEAHLALFPSPT